MRNEYVTALLLKEYHKVCGKIFADYYLHMKSTGKEKESIKAMDFLDAIVTGKNIHEEWHVEKTDDYKIMIELIDVINQIQ